MNRLQLPSREVLAAAQAEVASEDFRAAVEAQKARIRARRTPWQRLLGLLPFTITITWRT